MLFLKKLKKSKEKFKNVPRKKKTGGITLIALVITVIIMLILAGVIVKSSTEFITAAEIMAEQYYGEEVLNYNKENLTCKMQKKNKEKSIDI